MPRSIFLLSAGRAGVPVLVAALYDWRLAPVRERTLRFILPPASAFWRPGFPGFPGQADGLAFVGVRATLRAPGLWRLDGVVKRPFGDSGVIVRSGAVVAGAGGWGLKVES